MMGWIMAAEAASPAGGSAAGICGSAMTCSPIIIPVQTKKN